MGSLYISEEPRQGEYKESVGLDIDEEIIGEAPNGKNYYDYEPIYQLYYSLLNVHLWSRDYVKNTNELLKKYI